MSTGIRIECNREVSSAGVKGYRITKIQALTRKDLPELYLNSGTSVVLSTYEGNVQRLYLFKEGNTLSFNGLTYISQGFYSVEDMERILAHCAAAGQHLMEVNTYLRKEHEAWQGPVTFDVCGQFILRRE